MRKFESEAKEFCEAIKKMAESEALENFESYLSYHFDIWLKKYAYDVNGIVSEVKQFSEIH